jgi:hypothetical protein
MKFVNPNINRVTLMKSPDFIVKEELRKIICDKYGLEGDCIINEMIDDIYEMLFKINL